MAPRERHSRPVPLPLGKLQRGRTSFDVELLVAM